MAALGARRSALCASTSRATAPARPSLVARAMATQVRISSDSFTSYHNGLSRAIG